VPKNLEHPPGRPIVASTESILSPLAIFLEKVLTPIIRDFLHELEKFTSLPGDSILVSLDVKDLYASIPHSQGISSVKHLLTTSGLNPDIIDFCIDLLTLVLRKNFFMFEYHFFLQSKGTAMGSNVALPYANSYMALFEEEVVYSDPLFQAYCPVWKRYIYDVFCIWTCTPQTLDLFFHNLNTAWPGLTFTITSSTQQVNFLDTLVMKDETGTLTKDLYTKPTDKNSLLPFQSIHLIATKKSIPRSQFKRVQRIVTEPTVLKTRTEEMYNKFRERVITHSYISYILRSDDNATFYALLILAFPNFRHIFLPCYKRPPNVRDSLVRADFGGTRHDTTQRFLKTPKNDTCPCLNCNQCNNVIRGDSFCHPHSGKKHKIKCFSTCDTTFVVYSIKCPCGLLYIGETTQPIKDRISKHKSIIRCKNMLLPLPFHFISKGHNI
ncbi:unnamed protein product, partial [Ranitomeya imitator]